MQKHHIIQSFNEHTFKNTLSDQFEQKSLQ